MPPHAIGHDTPDHQLIILKHITRGKPWVRRAQHNLLAPFLQTLYECFTVYSSDHDIAMHGRERFAHHQHITIVDPRFDHAVPTSTHQVGLWCIDIEKLIKGQSLFYMILRRAWKTSRHTS